MEKLNGQAHPKICPGWFERHCVPGCEGYKAADGSQKGDFSFRSWKLIIVVPTRSSRWIKCFTHVNNPNSFSAASLPLCASFTISARRALCMDDGISSFSNSANNLCKSVIHTSVGENVSNNRITLDRFSYFIILMSYRLTWGILVTRCANRESGPCSIKR